MHWGVIVCEHESSGSWRECGVRDLGFGMGAVNDGFPVAWYGVGNLRTD
jgi:hypothetical protein